MFEFGGRVDGTEGNSAQPSLVIWKEAGRRDREIHPQIGLDGPPATDRLTLRWAAGFGHNLHAAWSAGQWPSNGPLGFLRAGARYRVRSSSRSRRRHRAY
jgi:hypothetical protein